jgi:hypothetical protein
MAILVTFLKLRKSRQQIQTARPVNKTLNFKGKKINILRLFNNWKTDYY